MSINYAFAAGTTQLTNLLNAIGKIKITSSLMIMWTILTWIFVPYLGYKFGVNGAAFGYSLVGLSSVVAIFIAKKYVNFSVVDSMIKPLLATTIMALVVMVSQRLLSINFFNLGIIIVLGVVSYGISLLTMVGLTLIEDVKRSFKTVFKK